MPHAPPVTTATLRTSVKLRIPLVPPLKVRDRARVALARGIIETYQVVTHLLRLLASGIPQPRRVAFDYLQNEIRDRRGVS